MRGKVRSGCLFKGIGRGWEVFIRCKLENRSLSKVFQELRSARVFKEMEEVLVSALCTHGV
jgi:hypothetical protein